jgi:peroxiredoxin Q/BCP
MVELRKRPAPAPAAEPAKKKAAPKSKAKKDDAKTAEVVPEEQPSTTDNADASKEVITKTKPKVSSGPASPPKKGDQIDLETFGGEIETNSEQTVTLASLVENSKKGVVLFTYPKASTPYVHSKLYT